MGTQGLRVLGALALFWLGLGCDGPPVEPDAGAMEDAGMPRDAGPPDAGPPDAGPRLSGFELTEWTSCPGLPTTSATRCAELSVPIDWSRPDGPRITRPVRLFPATGARRGVLLWNPGGPGAPTYPGDAPIAGVTEVRAIYDRISIDWRGVGASVPNLRCPRPPSADISLYQTTGGVIGEAMARAIRLSRDATAECVAELDPLLVAHVGTEDMARDLEALRIALRERQLNYLGFSYGTVLGATYARMYPDRVGAFVLDSVVHPTASWEDDAEAQLASQDAALDRFFAWCADRDCAFARGRSAEELAVAFDGIATELLERPRYAIGPTGAENVLSTSILLGWIVGELVSPPSWSAIGRNLAAMEDGDFSSLAALLSEPSAELNVGLRTIGHLDFPLARDWEIEDAVEHFLGEIRPSAPRVGYLFGYYVGAELAIETEPMPLSFGAPLARPMLLIGNRHDTQTPYPGALAMREALDNDSYLVTYEGDGHGISTRVPCLRTQVARFLVDPSGPPDVTTCAALEITP